MTTEDSTTTPSKVRTQRPATLPYKAVSAACEEIGILCTAIEAACKHGLVLPYESENFDAAQNLWLIQNAVKTIGVIADHCIGGQMRGTEDWLRLPSMEQQEVKS